MTTEKMALRADTSGNGFRIPLKWVDPATGQERTPTPTATTYPLLTGFRAAGKSYLKLRQLTAEKVADHLCRDTHGREVICFQERFPCFDSYDYLHENRYYRWFYLCHQGQLTMVYYADDRKTLEVTEDLDKIHREHWEFIQKIWNLN